MNYARNQYRYRLKILLCCGLLALNGLGMGACSDSATSGGDLLEGPWISQGVNGNGEQTRINFTKGGDVTIEAYKRAETQFLSSPLDSGTYSAEIDSITFELATAGTVVAILRVVTDNHIMIDDTTFFRADADGNLTGGTIAGQIRINDGTTEQQSVVRDPSTIPSAIKTIRTDLQGLQVEGAPPRTGGGMRMQSIPAPDDTEYSRQWGMRAVNAPGAWAIFDALTGTSYVTVAVADTGKSENEDLEGVWVDSGEYDFITEGSLDGDGPDADSSDEGDDGYGKGQHSWHGTHLAGIIAAKRNNATGVVGMSPQTRILPLRVIAPEPAGSIRDITNGILYAAGLLDQNGQPVNVTPLAKVINLSLGCFDTDTGLVDPCSEPGEVGIGDPNHYMYKAIQDVLARGVVVVAAAGNCHQHIDLCTEPFYPADYPGVIKVGGLDSNGMFAEGLSVQSPLQSVTAPSGSFEASGNAVGGETQVINTIGDDAYSGRIGTSQAAGFVSGVASMMLSIDPTLTPAEVKSIIEDTALDLGDIGRDDKYGHGLLNAGAAIEAVATSSSSSAGLDSAPAAELLLSENDVNFGHIKAKRLVFAHQVGKGPVSNITAQSDAEWLTVDVGSTTAPAAIALNVDRTKTAMGQNIATVTVTSDAGTEEISVSAHMSQGSSDGGDALDDWLNDVGDVFSGSFGEPAYSNTTDIGEIIVMLIKVDDNTVYAAIKTDIYSNYQFNFSALPDGEYYVMAGRANDIDRVCDLENTPEIPCTAYPSYDSPQIITVAGGNVAEEVILGL